MTRRADADDFISRLEREARQLDAQAAQASARVGQPAAFEELIDQRSLRQILKDAFTPSAEEPEQREQRRQEKLVQKEQRRQEKLERRAAEEAVAAYKRHNFIYDDTVRIWRDDAMEWMTDYEYVDWYEGYYYDPDNPY